MLLEAALADSLSRSEACLPREVEMLPLLGSDLRGQFMRIGVLDVE